MPRPPLTEEEWPYSFKLTLEDVDALESLKANPVYQLWFQRLQECVNIQAGIALNRGDTEYDKGMVAGYSETGMLLDYMIQEAQGKQEEEVTE